MVFWWVGLGGGAWGLLWLPGAAWSHSAYPKSLWHLCWLLGEMEDQGKGSFLLNGHFASSLKSLRAWKDASEHLQRDHCAGRAARGHWILPLSGQFGMQGPDMGLDEARLQSLPLLCRGAVSCQEPT